MKHSEHTLNTLHIQNEGIKESLKHEILDLLVDGPSSFAALYGGLVGHCGYPRSLDLFQIMEVLLEMEGQGWVKASQMAGNGIFYEPTKEKRDSDLIAYQEWLPSAEFEELSLDEVGLWYELTAKGRSEWDGWFSGEEQSQKWMIDDLSDTQTIIIQAETIERAEKVLDWWLSHNPQVTLVSTSRNVNSVSSFTLNDGTSITKGVKLTYRYN